MHKAIENAFDEIDAGVFSGDAFHNNEASVPAWLDVSYDLVITGTFVWFGAWVTAMFYFIHMLILQGAWVKAGENESNENNKAP